MRSSVRVRAGIALAAGFVSLAIWGAGIAAAKSTTGTVATGVSKSALAKVSLTVATFPGDGVDVLLNAAGLAKTPYQVHYIYFPSGALQSGAVNSGTADLAGGTAIGNIMVQSSGQQHYTSIASWTANTLQQATMVGPNSSITSIAQLQGQKVAFEPDTTAEYFLLKQLQSAGLSLSDITPVALEPAEALAALLSGSVAAIATFGNVDLAQLQGARILQSGAKYLAGKLGADALSYNLYDPDLKSKAKRVAVADLLARIDTAWAWARHHEDTWAHIEATATGQAYWYELATFQQGEAQAPDTITPVQKPVIAQQQAIASTFASAGVIPAPLKVSTTYSDVLTPLLSADEANYEALYPKWFSQTS